MNIAITVDPHIPVPPRLYGGIERVVDFLVRGLVERGHAVALLAHPESDTPARLFPYGAPPHVGVGPRLKELWQVGACLWPRRNEFELIHSFGRLAALVPILPSRRLKKLQTYQRAEVPWGSVGKAVRLAGDSIRFTGCSSSVFRRRVEFGALGGNWDAVFNGVSMAKYDFRASVSADAPLAFLGRIEPVKGLHHAITIAKAAGRRLVIAGNRVDTPDEARYFDEQIAPRIDGEQVQYIGPVDDAQKNATLGAAAAFLMPIEWEEPFGIVMAEALACGTPVIGFARGSVPEVVRDGVNGFACRTPEEAVALVGRLGEIDRAAVRADCEERFSDRAIVDAYERIYREMLDGRGA